MWDSSSLNTLVNCHRRCDNSQTETRISRGCKSDLRGSIWGLERAGVWQKGRTRIWVPTTRRLKLLVQGTLWVVLILLWVQGSSFCGCGYGLSHNCAAHTALLRYHLILQTMRGRFPRCLHWLCFQRPVSFLVNLLLAVYSSSTASHRSLAVL